MNAIKCSLAGCAIFAFLAVVTMGLFAVLTAGNKNNSAEPPPQVQNGQLDAAQNNNDGSNNPNGGSSVASNSQNPVCQDLYKRLKTYNIDVQIFNDAANRWGVPAHRLIAQAETESNFRPNAVSSVGAQGLMQFMPDTWREQTSGASNVSPFNPRDAAWYGAKYMRGHYDNNNHSWDLALAAYNAGQGNVDKYHGIPPFPETQNYITRINGLANKYQQCVQSGSGGGGDAPTGNRAQLARQILDNRQINLLTIHVANRVHFASTAKGNINDTAAGRTAARSPDCQAGNVNLSETMLKNTLTLAQQYSFRITYFAGGCHSASSYHYQGRAVDFDIINGRDVNASNPSIGQFLARCRELGAVEVIGPGSPGHDTHIHCAW